MGLYLRQDEQRSELQTRVAAEMQERMRTKPAMAHDDSEPTMLRDLQVMKHASLTITIMIAVFVIVGMIILFQMS